MSAVCRNRRGTRSYEGEEGESRVQRALLVCGQKLLFPYKAPLSRTILLEWLRKMPNRELGYCCVQRCGQLRPWQKLLRHPLELRRFRPTVLSADRAIVRRNCGCSFSSTCVRVSSLHRLRSPSSFPKRGAREHFSSRVSECMSERVEKGERQLAPREKRGKESRRGKKRAGSV